jgi:AcrR family transcriptional regulator
MAEPSRIVSIDGRLQRSERTRQFIIEAYLTLLRENSKVPTAAQIAERAGYSVRSLFERFPDLMGLSLAAADFAFEQANTQAVIRNVGADRPTRIRTQVETRGQTCERWLALWRALHVNQHHSPELKQRIRIMREAVVRRLELMYRPELSTLAEGDRRRTLIALEALTDFESWAEMRGRHELAFVDACAVWIRAIDGLLPPTPAVS